MREKWPFPWAGSYPEGVSQKLIYPQQSLWLFLEIAASRWPQQSAVIFFGKKITYQRLAAEAQRFAAALVACGIEKGDRIAVMLPNCPQFIISYYGILRAGAVVVPINPVNVERELIQQLRNVGCKMIVCLDTKHEMIQKVREEAGIRYSIVTGLQDYMSPLAAYKHRLLGQRRGIPLHLPAATGLFRLTEFISQAPARAPLISIDPSDDLAVLQYTGGTSGTPKAAMLTHYNLVANSLQLKEWFVGCREGQEVCLSVMPFSHVYGMTCGLNLAVALGATLVVHPRFKTERVLADIERHKITVFPGTPAMYVAINSHASTPAYDLSSLRYCVSGAAALSPDVVRVFEENGGGVLLEGYGLTEASPVTHCTPLTGMRKPRSVGIPLPDTECKIVDLKTGEEELPLGAAGELVIRGPQVMKGYWQRPVETARILRDGWLFTGDIARMDESGYTYLVDRKKDMIISGGYNIYPQHVESVIRELPQVKEVAVAGIPDIYRGETLKAYVVLLEDASLSEEQLLEHCKLRLASYKVPRLIEFRRELPKTMDGKILRRVLIEEEKNRPPDL